MTTSQPPDSWLAPQWHPDFGDAAAELAHLKTVANALIEAVPLESIELDIPEPGLMLLKMTREGTILAEIYSVQQQDNTGQRRYGLFIFPGTPEEQEHYATSVDAVMRLLNKA